MKERLQLGGYEETQHMTGINGGTTVTTGFGWNTILSVADKVIDAVKDGAIQHFFLVGGCDGARTGRNYLYRVCRESAKRHYDSELWPVESIVLTTLILEKLEVCHVFWIWDNAMMLTVQFVVALALSEAFACDVNELPLTLVLSWYEQKAVCLFY